MFGINFRGPKSPEAKPSPPPEVPEEKDTEAYNPDWENLGKKVESGKYKYGGGGTVTAPTPDAAEYPTDEARTPVDAQKLQEGFTDVQEEARKAGRKAREERGEPTDAPIYDPSNPEN